MKIGLWIALIIASTVLYSASAHAAISGNWVMCGGCTTRANFESAARVWYGSRTGNYEIRVGNPNTGVIYHIWLQSNTSGVPKIMANSQFIYSEPTKNVITNNDLMASSLAAATGGIVINSSGEETLHEEDFRAAVAATKNEVLFNATPDMIDTGGFNSFGSYQPDSVCPAAWSMMTAANPKWANAMNGLGSAFVFALKEFFGHGPQASVIFANGDVASFENNPLGGPSACTYVKGTAKDRFGNKLPDPVSGATSGGSGGIPAGSVVGHSDESWYQQGEAWLVCSYTNQILNGCYVQYVQP